MRSSSEGERPRITCCSPASLCFVFVVAFIAWIPLTLASVFWWHPLAIATVPIALGIGCAANWIKNRTLHCSMTAPILLIGGILIVLANLDVIHANGTAISAAIAIGVAVAFLIEWQYFARRSPQC